jgi:hypothetical protein
MSLDQRLASAGVHPFGLFQQEVMREFYDHPTARELVLCWGRGSGKTQALLKVVCTETIFGVFDIAPGETHIADLTSRLKDEAGKAVAILSNYFKILGIAHTAIDGLISLRDMPRAVRITAASVAATSGWRSYFTGADEYGKWSAEGSLGFDAREVLASKKAQRVTHEQARGVIAGTPMLIASPFHELVETGTNDRQIVSVAPTWIATSNRITEAMTRRLEPNEKVHDREYGAAFSLEWLEGFFAGLVDGCVAPWSSQPYDARHRYTVSIDPAFARDIFAISVQHREGPRVIVDRVEAMAPPRSGQGLSPTACLRRVRAICTEFHAPRALTDQHHAASLIDLANREGVKLEPIAWTATSKSERFETVRVLMRDRKLDIPDDKPLLRELSGISVRLLPSGHEQIQGRSGFTDDRVAAMVLGVSTLATSTPGSRMRNALAGFDVGAQRSALAPGVSSEHTREMRDLGFLITR